MTVIKRGTIDVISEQMFGRSRLQVCSNVDSEEEEGVSLGATRVSKS